MIDCETETPNAFAQILHAGVHGFRADLPITDGGADSGPGPHDYFDAALAACKTLTAFWYAKKHALPLERVESHVERDNAQERQGVYGLKISLAFHGPLTDEQRQQLYSAVGRCPIHKLMTEVDVGIETAPLG